MSDLKEIDEHAAIFGIHRKKPNPNADKLEMLDWFWSLLHSGSTTGMIRRAIHNKRVEITGEGEKA